MAYQFGGSQMPGPHETVSRSGRPDEGNLVFGIAAIKIHTWAPRCKRERDGLSAEDAYDTMALDASYVGTGRRKAMDTVAAWRWVKTDKLTCASPASVANAGASRLGLTSLPSPECLAAVLPTRLKSTKPSFSNFFLPGGGQHPMESGDHLRSVTDGGGDALDGVGAHIAHREDALAAGFEDLLSVASLGARQNEPALIQPDAGSGQPVGIGLGADE